MTTTAEQMRAWRGPTLFTYGFRPFFLGATVWAALAMAFWVPMLSGHMTLPTAFDPVSWHAHEFLFGYLTAVAAGFLLTAVPNWTGRLPIVGWPLAGLFGLWVAGRIAVAVSAILPPLLVGLVDLAMPLALAAVIAGEIIAGKNWRNLIVLAMLCVLALGRRVSLGGRPGRICGAGCRAAYWSGRRADDDRRNWRSCRAVIHPQLVGQTQCHAPAGPTDAAF